jgi:hypothetical protein
LGGPVAFFNEAGDQVVIVSSLSNFMVANAEVFKVDEEVIIDFGLMGSIEVLKVLESVRFFLGDKKCSDLNFPHFFVN